MTTMTKTTAATKVAEAIRAHLGEEFYVAEAIKWVLDANPEWVAEKTEDYNCAKEAVHKIYHSISGMFSINRVHDFEKEGLYVASHRKEGSKNIYSFSDVPVTDDIDDSEIEAIEEEILEEYNRNAIIKDAEAKWSSLEKRKFKDFGRIQDDLNSLMGVKVQDKEFFFEKDHAQALKDGGMHHYSNIQLLTKVYNISKNDRSMTRFTVEEQKEYIRRIFNFYLSNRFMDAQEVIEKTEELEYILSQLDILFS